MKRLAITAITALALIAGATATATAATEHHCTQVELQHKVTADAKTSCRTARAVELGLNARVELRPAFPQRRRTAVGLRERR